jgi:hypothetical protein
MLSRVKALLCGLCVVGCAGSPAQDTQPMPHVTKSRSTSARTPGVVPRALAGDCPAKPIGYEVPNPPPPPLGCGVARNYSPGPAILFQLSLLPVWDPYTDWLYVNEEQYPDIQARFVATKGHYPTPPN